MQFRGPLQPKYVISEKSYFNDKLPLSGMDRLPPQKNAGGRHESGDYRPRPTLLRRACVLRSRLWPPGPPDHYLKSHVESETAMAGSWSPRHK